MNVPFSWLLAALAALMLAGCASSPETGVSSRYALAQDRAPAGNFDVSSLSDAQPRYEEPRQAGNKSPYTVWGKTYRVLASNDGYVARGTASWYGEKFHGHKTSNGEIFDMYQMSAAHKSLRIPSYARVTNLENGRSVIVRVNDRGPFHSDRLIDLSYAAAKKLGFQERGTAPVEVAAITVRSDGSMFLAGEPFQLGESHSPAASAPVVAEASTGGVEQALFVQLGSFSSRDPAEALVSRVRALLGNPARIRAFQTGSGLFHRVQVGPFETEEDARQTQALLESHGFSQTILLTDSH
ncbi:septal ring lytic transglycosylase RlpA family protein [uncultured Marinobacter sp.]|jgi:rare lipoprotein A|uniref:septal ring lytic transglycosylase RlpA family protein n=1 Tax=uncultured Marinobacter sp. TaxID=187379 RepID=UPI000C0B66A8|nr:septal ring lytic transglycosylase RlpA [Marinobacter sp.]MBI43721.1 septal ring lytic transglycosylase RlpA [Oceanospirillales bacterium]|tara:strand:+ start:4133 stop:5023 length:891 start_codon:yes stop_codon:yes gene_type:complete